MAVKVEDKGQVSNLLLDDLKKLTAVMENKRY